MLKAIETHYNGFRFRSRLEARWAVFLDSLKIEYTYEPEGYFLHDDSKYLPDFFLLNVRGGMWIEIKPLGIDISASLKKLEMLCTITDHPGLLVAGDPMGNVHIAEGDNTLWENDGWTIVLKEGDEYQGCDAPYIFCICPWCGKIGVEYDGRGARVCGYRAHFDTEEDALAAIRHLGHHRADDKCYTGNHPLIYRAAEKARQARFEYGETA
jgi:hypothetical protein